MIDCGFVVDFISSLEFFRDLDYQVEVLDSESQTSDDVCYIWWGWTSDDVGSTYVATSLRVFPYLSN